MPLLLGQLVYTSFPKIGFRTLASAQVPLEIQQAFIQQVANRHWNSYSPPRSGYRAAYLHQVDLEHNLFGWLYNDGLDDLGRSHVPYFVCYYLAESLHATQLDNIFTCLHRGPVALIDRRHLPAALETIAAPDLWSYQPAGAGVAVPVDVRDRSHIALKQRELLDLFFPADEWEVITELNEQFYRQPAATLPVHAHRLVVEGIETSTAEIKEGGATETGALKPREEYWERLQLYEQVLVDAVQQGYPLSDHTRVRLKLLQQVSELKDEDVVAMEARITQQRTAVQPPPAGIATISKRRAQAAVIPVYKSPQRLIRIGIMTILALIAAGYALRQWQGLQPLQVIDPLEAGAGWQNVRAQSLTGHSDSVWSAVISPDGQTLISGSGDKTIKVWDLQSGEVLHTLSKHSDTVRSVAISPDGQTLVSGVADNTIKIQNLGTGELLHTLSGHSAPVWSVAISPDGQTLVSGSLDKTIKIWHLQSGELLHTLSGHSAPVWSVAISPDGQTLVSGSKDKTIKVWDLQSGEVLHTLSKHLDTVRSVAISPDGQTLVSSSWDQTIKVWHLQSGKLLHTLAGHLDWVFSVAISPDGQTLVSGSLDKTIKIWHLQSGELLRTLPGHSDWVLCVAISPDGGTVVSGSKDKTIRVWRQ